MHSSRPELPKSYRASDLRQRVSSVPNDTRTLHTLFAVLMNQIDRQADINQSIKPDIVEGLAQAWLFVAEQEGVDVEVEQSRGGVSTDIDDPSDDRPASSRSFNGREDLQFDERLQDRPEEDVPLDKFIRDMRRLDDLRRQYACPGLNSAEGNEAEELREKYNLDHHEWYQRQYLASDTDGRKDYRTSSPDAFAD